jgi:Lar family restriction alleviation protein
MTELELLRCPFCNSEAYISHGFINGNPNPWPYIECLKCAASTDFSETNENAVNKWNTRK